MAAGDLPDLNQQRRRLVVGRNRLAHHDEPVVVAREVLAGLLALPRGLPLRGDIAL